MNWVANRPGVAAVLIGATNESQLDHNLRSLDFIVPDELLGPSRHCQSAGDALPIHLLRTGHAVHGAGRERGRRQAGPVRSTKPTPMALSQDTSMKCFRLPIFSILCITLAADGNAPNVTRCMEPAVARLKLHTDLELATVARAKFLSRAAWPRRPLVRPTARMEIGSGSRVDAHFGEPRFPLERFVVPERDRACDEASRSW